MTGTFILTGFIMRERKTNFRWFKKKGSRKLTNKAKKHLSKKLNEYHSKRFRYSAFRLWTVREDDESYYPQLEIKAHIFSKPKLNQQQTKIRLNAMIDKIKKQYDFNQFFEYEVTRLRIAYAFERISKEEAEPINMIILTVNDSEDSIRPGFPKRWLF